MPKLKKKSKLKSSQKNNFNIYDTIIIGAGIAGCTAAIYAARKRMKYALLADIFSGQFMESGEILNYPGIKHTTGAAFSKLMEEQLKFNGVIPTLSRVERIKRKGINFLVKTKNKDYFTKSVIVATGSHPRRLEVPGEKKFKHRGLTYCSICDGPLFSGKTAAVIGGGDSALEAAYFLLDIAKKIYIVNIMNKFKAHEYLQENILNHPKVEVIFNAATKEIFGDKLGNKSGSKTVNKFVKGIRYEQNGKLKELKVEGVFVEIGRVPNTEFVHGFLKLDEHQHILINCATETSVPGVFAAGDCSSVHEYQYVIAAGQGCTALLKVARYLAGKS